MSDTAKRLSKGIFLKSISGQSVMFAGLVISILLNRHYGKELYGMVVLTYTLIGFVASLSSFGVKPAISRFLPQYLKRRNFKASASMILISFFCQAIGIVLFAFLILLLGGPISQNVYHKPQLAPYLAAGIAYMIGNSLSDYVFQIFQAMQDWKKEAAVNIIYNGTYLLFVAMIVFFLKIPIMAIFYANMAAALITLIFAVMAMPRRILIYLPRLPKPRVARAQTKKIFNFSLPLTITPVTLFLSTWFDKAVLGRYVSLGELSFYYIAFLFYNALLNFFKTLSIVLLPYMSTIADASQNEIKRKFQIIFRWFSYVSIFLCIVSFFAIKPLVIFLYGAGYEKAIFIFRLFLILFFIRSIGNSLGIFSFNVFGLTYQLAISGIVLTVSTILANLLFVSALGCTGAILGNIVAFLIHLAVYLYLMKPVTRLISVKTTGKIFITVSALVIFYLASLHLGLRNEFVLFGGLLAVFIGALKLQNEIRPDDIKVLHSFLSVSKIYKSI